MQLRAPRLRVARQAPASSGWPQRRHHRPRPGRDVVAPVARRQRRHPHRGREWPRRARRRSPPRRRRHPRPARRRAGPAPARPDRRHRRRRHPPLLPASRAQGRQRRRPSPRGGPRHPRRRRLRPRPAEPPRERRALLGRPPGAARSHRCPTGSSNDSRRRSTSPRPAVDSFHRGDDTTAWARAALRGELERLEQAKPGYRNNTLNRVAFRLGQIIAGGQLDEAEVESMLIDGAVSLGLGEREAVATVHSGMHAGEAADLDGRLDRCRSADAPEVR